MSERPLAGKTALITGGGSGIGAAVAQRLGMAGASVVLVGRTEKRLAAEARRLSEVGVEARGIPCDVTDPAGVNALAADAGAVDILVNNAGVASASPLAKLTLEEWNRIFAVNVTGTFLCTRAFVPGMAERWWGRVVNVASVAGLAGAKYISAYAASKHAVIGFTRSVAAEVAAQGVTVNAVCPGYVDTAMTRESVDRIVAKTGRSREDALGAILATSPQARLIEPDEVAHAVFALCVHEARGINGQAIVLDGGGLLA